MSLLDKMLKAGSVKTSNVLSKSAFFQEKDPIKTELPIVNIAFSGSLNGGLIPGLTVVAVESKSFKTLLGLYCMKAYLEKYKDGVALLYDSEYGITPEYLESYNIDINRVIHIPIEDVEQLKFDMTKRLNEIDKGDRVYVMIDSIGNLASRKEVEDAENEKSVADMSRAKQLAKKARDAQKTNENNSAPQTAAHRRAMMGLLKKRAKDNEKARQALKDPDHNPAWANSTTPKSKLEATLVRGKEVHDKTFANRTQADNFAKKNGGRVRQVGRVFYVFKESVNEGRPSQQHPLEDHPYHRKTNAQLIYIGKDAHAAAEAMKGHNTEKENKYRDQANDAATVRHFRKKNGMPDWYKKKYGHGVKESVELDGKFLVKEGSVPIIIKQLINTADRYKMIKKIGDKLNKEKKKAERDAMRHAKRDNEYQTESSASDEGERAASQGQSYSSNPYPKGSPNHLEWSKGHNKARARRLNMGESKEEFTLKHFHKNEDENRHTENGVKLVNKFGTSAENIKMGGIAARHNMRGSISRKDQQDRDALVKKYYPKLKETTSVKKTNEATQFKVDV